MRQVIRGERHDVFRTRESSLDQHLPWLDDQWAAGCRNGAELGAAYGRAASEAPFVLSANGRLVDGGPKRLMSKPFIGFHRPERSLVS